MGLNMKTLALFFNLRDFMAIVEVTVNNSFALPTNVINSISLINQRHHPDLKRHRQE